MPIHITSTGQSLHALSVPECAKQLAAKLLHDVKSPHEFEGGPEELGRELQRLHEITLPDLSEELIGDRSKSRVYVHLDDNAFSAFKTDIQFASKKLNEYLQENPS